MFNVQCAHLDVPRGQCMEHCVTHPMYGSRHRIFCQQSTLRQVQHANQTDIWTLVEGGLQKKLGCSPVQTLTLYDDYMKFVD